MSTHVGLVGCSTHNTGKVRMVNAATARFRAAKTSILDCGQTCIPSTKSVVSKVVWAYAAFTPMTMKEKPITTPGAMDQSSWSHISFEKVTHRAPLSASPT